MIYWNFARALPDLSVNVAPDIESRNYVENEMRWGWKGPWGLVQTLEEGQSLIGLLCVFLAEEKSYGTGELAKDQLSG